MQTITGQSARALQETGVHRILICADGTCNAFGSDESNVARLLRHVWLGRLRGDEQVAVYDQGLGSQIGQYKASLQFKATVCRPKAFEVVAPPKESIFRPKTYRKWVNAMTRGEGLGDNVRQLYMALAQRYRPSSEVHLFGFSRGAFTVRALAAMTWRFGLPASGDPVDACERFTEYWPRLEGEYGAADGTPGGVVSEPRLEPGMQAPDQQGGSAARTA